MPDAGVSIAASPAAIADVDTVPDGLEVLQDDLPDLVALIARTALWVDPKTFRLLPTWYPEFYRGAPAYKADWQTRYTNTNRTTKVKTENVETNIKAGKALCSALGIPTGRRPRNWSVCHLWGVDDPSFQTTNNVIKNARYYSCVANMVLLPAPLKGATDSIPEVKRILRTAAFHLYGWVCDHDDVKDDADWIRAGNLPEHYPAGWPGCTPGPQRIRVRPLSDGIRDAILKRMAEIKDGLATEGNSGVSRYPYDQVQDVQRYWAAFLQRV
ncbi:hypothetical protein [Roseomonas genomospecies 6]|uniref:Uncharacterized protein n=1 Tax=Roseomonas genomospecies 6 TaxID=214106 RepID=A0A9W7NJA0_9PROT|nr:hypothetical protein [Roseomonas genomospecies 6]KAA0680351.1 hypothetical protein DS843_13640 [Roseomonas genomospecies 6]